MTLKEMTAPIYDIHKTFQDARQMARLSGKVLAFALASSHPFLTQSISLIGFSLGAQVIKSCLKTLHDLGATSVIHNVTLLGGATAIMPAKIPLWEDIFAKTVNGEIKNCYTSND